MHAILHHMAMHAWGWVGALSVLGALGIYFRLTTPAAFLLMFAGLLIMMRAEGTSLEHIVESDELGGDGSESTETQRQAETV